MEFLADFAFVYQSLIYAVGINGLLALSVYVSLSAGQLSLGQAGFMAIGAYSSALLSLKYDAFFPLALAMGMLIPALFAALISIPTLRLSGVYLALTTIGVGELVRVFFVNLDSAGGALGLSGIPEKGSFALIYGCLFIVLFGMFAFARSKFGRAIEAMREDETAAGTMGINFPRYRLAVLVVSAAIAGLAGGLNAHVSSFIGPAEYGFDLAVSILSFALLGGISNPLGPVLGAIVLTILPEVLRPIHDYRLAVNGAVIVIVMIFCPEGVFAWRIRRTGAAV